MPEEFEGLQFLGRSCAGVPQNRHVGQDCHERTAWHLVAFLKRDAGPVSRNDDVVVGASGRLIGTDEVRPDARVTKRFDPGVCLGSHDGVDLGARRCGKLTVGNFTNSLVSGSTPS